MSFFHTSVRSLRLILVRSRSGVISPRGSLWSSLAISTIFRPAAVRTSWLQHFPCFSSKKPRTYRLYLVVNLPNSQVSPGLPPTFTSSIHNPEILVGFDPICDPRLTRCHRLGPIIEWNNGSFLETRPSWGICSQTHSASDWTTWTLSM